MLGQNWKEAKRIKALFLRYQALVGTMDSESTARRELIGELQMTAGRLGDQLSRFDAETKEKEITALFSPLDVLSYDAPKLVAFMVSWENPARYNERLTIEQIRAGSGARSDLDRRVTRIAARMGIATEKQKSV